MKTSSLCLVLRCRGSKAGLSWNWQVKRVYFPSLCPCRFKLPLSREVSVVRLLTWWFRAPVNKRKLGIPKSLLFLDLKSHVVCKFKGSSHRSSFPTSEIAKGLQPCFRTAPFPSCRMMALIFFLQGLPRFPPA